MPYWAMKLTLVNHCAQESCRVSEVCSRILYRIHGRLAAVEAVIKKRFLSPSGVVGSQYKAIVQVSSGSLTELLAINKYLRFLVIPVSF